MAKDAKGERGGGQRSTGREPSTRAFVALDLPRSLLGELSDWSGAALAHRPELRPIPARSLHLTLAFLGGLEAGPLERARAVVSRVEVSTVEARLERAPLGVPRRRPGVIAFAVESPDAIAVRERLAAALRSEGLLEADRRAFWPHLSVARVRAAPGGRRDRASPGELPPLPDAATQTFGFVRVALYRSELRSEGARYSSLTAIDLQPRSGR